jgi:polar amino acid transport system substrate-binding protein
MVSRVRLVADPYPPYQYEEGGSVRGVDHDIIEEAFKVRGIIAETDLYSWDECIAQMDEEKAGGIFQITRTTERVRRFIFSHELRTATTLFFKNKDLCIVTDGSAEPALLLRSHKIGVLSGYSYDPVVDNVSGELKVEKQSSESLLYGLLAGEFDLALLDLGVAAYLIKKLRIEGLDSIPGYKIMRHLYVAFRKDLRELVDLFDSGLQEIKENGVYDGIFRKYGLQYIPSVR